MDRAHILVIEDDAEISCLLKKYLLKERYTVDSAYDGEEAINLFSSNIYDLVILDLMLPKVDGYQILMKIRQNSNIPVLIISAKAEVTERIVGLELGADDYIIKPFSVQEVIARVKTHLRRHSVQEQETKGEQTSLSYNDLELNLHTYVLKVGDKSVELTLKEFSILKFFISNPNRVFTRAQVFDKVWGESFLGDDNTVMVHIRRLREKMEEDPSKPKYIQTIWGIGYKLA